MLHNTFSTNCYKNTIWKRSEEHTSELQSRSDLVCRLLLEKKKKHYAAFQTHLLIDDHQTPPVIRQRADHPESLVPQPGLERVADTGAQPQARTDGTTSPSL